MNDNVQTTEKKHSVVMQSRRKLDIDGVIDVLDFDSSCVNINTNMGIMSIEGESLKIISLSKETGKMYIEGNIDSLYYCTVAEEKRSGIFKRRVK